MMMRGKRSRARARRLRRVLCRARQRRVSTGPLGRRVMAGWPAGWLRVEPMMEPGIVQIPCTEQAKYVAYPVHVDESSHVRQAN